MVEVIVIAVVVLIVGGLGLYFILGNDDSSDETANTQETTTTDSAEETTTDSSPAEKVSLEDFSLVGKLSDVTNGEDVRGINTGGNSMGEAGMKYEDGKFTLYVETDVPDPQGTDFYEGWVVGSAGVVSTGKLEKVTDQDGVTYVNNFMSDEDLTVNTKYVLTLEPDDGDPAPADHILEGTLN